MARTPRPARSRVELLNELDDPDHSVLVYVDPAGRRLEIVTGSAAKRQLLGHARGARRARRMQTSFAAGDLTGGLVTGVQQLGDHAHLPTLLHVNEPHQQ